MSDENAKAHVIVSGRVQGVFFRMETKKAVDKIGVAGWVRNLPDGTVEAVFEGRQDKVQAAVKWCHKGAPLSSVTNVSVDWESYTGQEQGFDIRY